MRPQDVSGHRDQPAFLELGDGAQCQSEINAIDSRKPDIQESDVWFELGGNANGASSIVRQAYFVAVAGYRQRNNLRGIPVIFHD